MKRRFITMAICAVVVLVTPLVLNATDQQFYLGLATRILVLAMAVSALDFVLGYGGMVSFGHALFFGWGGYVAGVLSFHDFDESAVFSVFGLEVAGTNNALIAWPLAIVLGGVLGAVVGAAAVRTSGPYLIMITLALAQVSFYFFNSLQRYGGDDGTSTYWGRNELLGLDTNNDTVFYYIVALLLIITIALLQTLVRTNVGRVVRAGKQNETRTRALGYQLTSYRVRAWVASGAITSLAGALSVNHSEFFSPGLAHWTLSGEFLVMNALGGIGTIIGGFLGAAALLISEELVSLFSSRWQLFLGLGIVGFVVFAGNGIAGILFRGTSDE